jgi:hypothetical protein
MRIDENISKEISEQKYKFEDLKKKKLKDQSQNGMSKFKYFL